MRLRTAVFGLLVVSAARPVSAALPPGRQHLLTIEGENTVTFIPAANLNPSRVDYQARVEYLVNTRSGPDVETKAAGTARRKPSRKTSAKPSRADADAPKAAGAVDVAVHSSQMRFRQNGQMVVESRVSRSRFQGRFLPDTPVVSVSYNDAPAALQDVMKRFDTPAASILIDDRARVIRRAVRVDGPLRALAETLLSIHTPIPTDAAFWEAPTQLAMGHGQTAKGNLRFDKVKDDLAKTGGLVKVKVSGELKAEGAVVGNLIKDGTYTVTGEQAYDPDSREWKTAHWSVAIDNELANQRGVPVAHARGAMTVDSRALDDQKDRSPGTSPPASRP